MITKLDEACEALRECHSVAKRAAHASKKLANKLRFSKMCNDFANIRSTLLAHHFEYEDAMDIIKDQQAQIAAQAAERTR